MPRLPWLLHARRYPDPHGHRRVDRRRSDDGRRRAARSTIASGPASRSSENWLQLIRFGVVGVSGYIVNTVSFWFCLHVIGLDYKIALPIAYLAGVINNFTWNSRWTFTHERESHTAVQGAKFLVVSTVAFGCNYGLVVAGVHWVHLFSQHKVVINALANIMVIPVNFLGQKLWSFKK